MGLAVVVQCSYGRPVPPTIIKKYGNRRLYDTGDSRYITLDELAAKIRGGTDVRIVDAQTGDDLTQPTLVQIVLENGAAARLLPAPLLMQMVRLGDDGLGEFFSRYVSGALELYLQAKRGVQAVAQVNPLAALPLGAGDALARMWMASPFAAASPFGFAAPPPPGYAAPPPGYAAAPPPGYAPAPPPPPDEENEAAEARDDRRRDDDIAALRRELDELKRAQGLGKPGAKRKRKD
jgi:polyhydroxyalkanoate synthesis repressor PhaR